jgi:hypothetical protein
LLNALVQIANEMELQKKKKSYTWLFFIVASPYPGNVPHFSLSRQFGNIALTFY